MTPDAVHCQVVGFRVEGKPGGAVALQRPVPHARRADADRSRPHRRALLLRARRAEGLGRRRLGRRVEARPLRLGVQRPARQPGRRLPAAAAIRAGAGKPAAADRLRPAAASASTRAGPTASARPTRFDLEDLRDAATRNKLKWALSDPEQLRPGETRQALTERAAQRFATLAQSLRYRRPRSAGSGPLRQPAGLLHVRRGRGPPARQPLHPHAGARASCRPARVSPTWRSNLFGAMSRGRPRRVRGGGVVRRRALRRRRRPAAGPSPRSRPCATRGRWIGRRSIPSILGTLFERGLDPGKRAQLGAHYTDRDKIMLIVEPVIIRPLAGRMADGQEPDRRRAELRGGGPATRTLAKPSIRRKKTFAKPSSRG